MWPFASFIISPIAVIFLFFSTIGWRTWKSLTVCANCVMIPRTCSSMKLATKSVFFDSPGLRGVSVERSLNAWWNFREYVSNYLAVSETEYYLSFFALSTIPQSLQEIASDENWLHANQTCSVMSLEFFGHFDKK